MKEGKNPWKTLSEEVMYENNWIRVEHHEVLNPKNKAGIYGKVHFKYIAIGIIPVDLDGYTWIVGQFRYPLNQYSWEIPEGGGKIGIPTLDSARRELREETGIIAKGWTMIQEIHTSNSVSDEYGVIYLAEDLEFHAPQPDDDEELLIRKIHLRDLFKMITSGKITDSLSLAGIYKLKEILPQHFS